ncbi:MAG: hypothetical protein JSS27_05680 [Planctomycetes bacterium]|nr:hypothetical protein [Planctomycetota bacterium]
MSRRIKQPSRGRAGRRGVVLMIILGMLALFMLIVISFVLTASAEKRGAISAARAEQRGISHSNLLNMAALQVVRGTRDGRSVIGPHSLLEDMYGDREAVVGHFTQVLVPAMNAQSTPTSALFTVTGLIAYGPDRQPGIAGVDDDNNGIIDDVNDNLSGAKNSPTTDDTWLESYVGQNGASAQLEGRFAGCVLTVLDGPLANQSTRIVRWWGAGGTWSNNGSAGTLVIQPFKTAFNVTDVSAPPRRFLINGRPFNGSGFGNSTQYTKNNAGLATPVNGTRLNWPDPKTGSSMYGTINVTQNPNFSGQVPIGLMPNPTDSGYRGYLSDRPVRAGGNVPNTSGVDADEDYDAPDFQNMILAGRTYNPTTLTWEVTSPSLHRPDLCRFWVHALGLDSAGAPTGSYNMMATPSYLPLRRRFILRPDPADHFDNTDPSQNLMGAGKYVPPEPWADLNGNGIPEGGEYTDINGNGMWDQGSPTFVSINRFDPVFGGFDVDNDADGRYDSVWVDLGAPVQSWADGRLVKPMFAILCLDMDGRINLNTSGNPSHYRFSGTTATTLRTPPGPASFATAALSSDEVMSVGGYLFTSTRTGTAAPTTYTAPDWLDARNGTYSPAFARYNESASNISNVTTLGVAAVSPAVTLSTNSYTVYAPYISSLPTPSGAVNPTTPVLTGQGLGYSSADINLTPFLIAPYVDNGNANQFCRVNLYRWLLEGRAENLFPNYETSFIPHINGRPQGVQRPAVAGRYGEPHLVNPKTPGQPTPGALSLPRAGETSFIPSGGSLWNLAIGITPGDDNRPAAAIGYMPTTFYNTPGSQLYALYGGVTNPNFVGGDSAVETSGSLWYVGANVTPSPLNSALAAPALDPNAPGSGVAANMATGYYASPIDPNGRLTIGTDPMGRVTYAYGPTQTIRYSPGALASGLDAIPNEMIDDPWEFDPSGLSNRGTLVQGVLTGAGPSSPAPLMSPTDAPFTAAELQALLRGHDPDMQYMNSRLRQVWWGANDQTLATNHGTGILGGTYDPTRHRFTTESWDLPVPNLEPPPDVRDALALMGIDPTNLSFGELVVGRVAAAARWHGVNLTTGSLANMQTIARGLIDPANRFGQRGFSPDLVLSLRMDINRVLGNGFDDDSNGVVDDPMEMAKAANQEPAWKQPSAAYTVPPVAKLGTTMDLTWEGLFIPATGANTNGGLPVLGKPMPDIRARYELAKHLYCLMMLVMDSNYLDLGTPLVTSGVGGVGNIQPVWAEKGMPNTLTAATNPIQRMHILTAYRVAQWAVNVVDFRDRDSIMTPFEFDIYPFASQDPFKAGTWTPGGWEVDGALETVEDNPTPTTARNLFYRGVVWGMEYPEMQITETLAFHDLKIADTPMSPNANNNKPQNYFTKGANAGGADPHLDQVAIPEGSAFIEITCTGNAPPLTNDAKVQQAQKFHMLPNELYTKTTSGTNLPNDAYGALNLSATASQSGVASPVWRVAVTVPHRGVDAAPVSGAGKLGRDPTVREMLFDSQGAGAVNLYYPDSTTLQPEAMNIFDSTTPANPLLNYRIGWNMYFVASGTATQVPTKGAYQDYYIYSGGGVAPKYYLQSGQSAVLGPARSYVTGGTMPHVTQVGWTDKGMPSNKIGWTPQQFALPTTSGSLVINSSAQALTYPRPYSAVGSAGTDIKQPVCIPMGTASVSASTPTFYTGTRNFIGMNISEPPGGYTPPSNYQGPLMNLQLANGYKSYELFNPGNGTRGTSTLSTDIADVPFDMNQNNVFQNAGISSGAGGSNQSWATPGTYVDYATVFLQRLADPTMPWNPDKYDPQNGVNSGASKYNANLPINPYLTIDWMPIDLTVYSGMLVWPPQNADGVTYMNTPAAVTQKPLTAASAPHDGLLTTTWKGWTGAASVSTPPRNFVYDSTTNPLLLNSRQRGPRQFGQVLPGGISTSTTISGQFPVAATSSMSWQYTPYTIGSPALATPSQLVMSEAPIWSAISDDPRVSPSLGLSGGLTTGSFNQQVTLHTLGYVNDSYGHPLSYSGTSMTGAPFLPNAAVSVAALSAGVTGGREMIGAPQRPYPWLCWNNRPFASAHELMLVPASSPGRFGVEFSYITQAQYRAGLTSDQNFTATTMRYLRQLLTGNDYALRRGLSWGTWTAPVAGVGSPPRVPHLAWPALSPPWGLTPVVPTGNQADLLTPGQPFGHLLNFFASTCPGDTYQASMGTLGAGTYSPKAAPNFHRVFEFVTVPSRFSGTSDSLTDAACRPVQSTTTTNTPPAALDPFMAPHNKVSRFREPGKINLNTFVDAHCNLPNTLNSTGKLNPPYATLDCTAWVALTNGHPNSVGSQAARNGTITSGGVHLDSVWADFNANRYQFNDQNPLRYYATGTTTMSNTFNTFTWDHLNWTFGANNHLGAAQGVQALSVVGAASNPYVPSIYRIYRSYAGGMSAPIDEMFYADGVIPSGASSMFRPYLAADSNILRRLEPKLGYSNWKAPANVDVYTTVPYATSQPLFAFDGGPMAAMNTANTVMPSTQVAGNMYLTADGPSSLQNAHRDGKRDPYFRYQQHLKLSNLVTTRSNVYAVWVTVGFFEVSRIGPTKLQTTMKSDASYPNTDGFRLMREINSDIGAVERHRGFYLIDRSIPVAFVRGENYNVDNVFLLKRVIQ